ncbi:MAG: homoserine dehydrogenase [Planctomycetota bacterium]|nr:homoserine dehydrogenase [Planctomycetota bacterium]
MKTHTAKVALIGLGTIGTGVARLLLEKGDRLAGRAAMSIELVKIVDKDLKTKRDLVIPPGMFSDDLAEITSDAEIGTVVQLIGGLEPARTIMLKLLDCGKNVVTANKALLAEHGAELFDTARKNGCCIAFEAAVAGGVPIIAGIGQCLTANQIQSLHAILNGTSNFILSQMDQNGTPYAEAVAEAQRLGFAEADPSMDVDGTDAAQKLAILAQLAFGARVDWRDIPRIGIDAVEVADLRFAAELGYAIKLLAVAELVPEGLELYVSPTLVRRGTPMADVRDAYNAVRVVGDAVGCVFFHGLGAGQSPTASAVAADLIDTVVGRAAITFKTLDLWSDRREAPVSARDPNKIPGRYYLRFNVEDRSGVMCEIAGVLGRHDVSIASLIQHEADEDEAGNANIVPMIIMTHSASEGAICQAVEEIDKLTCVRPSSVRLRVRE